MPRPTRSGAAGRMPACARWAVRNRVRCSLEPFAWRRLGAVAPGVVRHRRLTLGLHLRWHEPVATRFPGQNLDALATPCGPRAAETHEAIDLVGRARPVDAQLGRIDLGGVDRL